MKKVIVNGDPFLVGPLNERDLKPGALVSPRERRSVYRIICSDGSDLIMRNVRHENIVEAVPANSMVSQYRLVVPGE